MTCSKILFVSDLEGNSVESPCCESPDPVEEIASSEDLGSCPSSRALSPSDSVVNNFGKRKRGDGKKMNKETLQEEHFDNSLRKSIQALAESSRNQVEIAKMQLDIQKQLVEAKEKRVELDIMLASTSTAEAQTFIQISQKLLLNKLLKEVNIPNDNARTIPVDDAAVSGADAEPDQPST